MLTSRWLPRSALGLLFALESACATPAPPPTPDVIVLRWVQAFAAQDGVTLSQLTCRANQTDAQNNRLLSLVLGTPPSYGGAGGAGGQFFGGGGQAVYDIANLQYATQSADTQAARVQVKGFVRMSSGMNSQTLPVNSVVPLIREQAQWRLCDSGGN